MNFSSKISMKNSIEKASLSQSIRSIPFKTSSSTSLVKEQWIGKESYLLSRNVGYQRDDHNQEENEDEEAVEIQPGLFPHGVFGSVVVPLLFCAAVAGGTISYVNTDAARERRRKRIADEARAKVLNEARGKDQLQNPFNQFNSVQQLTLGITAANLAVFLAWRVPALQPVLRRYFVHSITQTNPVSHLLSAFSHKTGLHFAFNMLAFYSIALGLQENLSREQILAIYLAGATTSSFASHMVKLATRDFAGSLGASGSVYALLATVTYFKPSTAFSLIFFPVISFSASSLLPFLVAFESLGLGLGAFRVFHTGMDHAAHLGGLMFGWVYSDYLMSQYKKRQNNKK
eukprot:TRINITY_DN9110_c2_g1_i1.p1 TRINITY_DN9110_c2_g1~~TRINITY_DN9110_c2_g1_i1.p1  ORF type:complete len:389 (+),score=149.65 TRINITY_DN9110_c2_g1_i1:135-1169(+)